MLFTLLLALPAHALSWKADQDVWPALYVDVTPEGFASFEDITRTVLPSTFPVDSSQINQSGSVDVILLGSDYSFGVDNLYLIPTLDDLTVVPVTDALNVSMQLSVGINLPDDPAVLHVNANLSLLGLIEFDVIDEDCAMHVDPLPVTLTLVARMSVARDRYDNVIRDDQGNITIDVAFDDVNYTIPDLEQEDLNLRSAPGGSCIVDDLLDVADFVGFDAVEDYLMEELTPTLDAQIETLVADLEVQVADAFKSLAIEETVDLLGTPLIVSVYPRDFNISPAGLRLEMGGHFDAGETPNPCVSRFDPGESVITLPPQDPRYPGVGETPAGIPRSLGALINDDWLNQATYAVWRAGLLCQEISDANSPVDLPIGINTDLLDLMGAREFAVFFPVTAPLIMKTRPEVPPVVRTADETGAPLDHNVDVVLDKLGLDMMAELDYRFVRVVGLDLTATAGLDLSYDGATGNLGVLVDFDPADIATVVSFNDLLPAVSPSIEQGFGALAELLIGPILDTALGNLSFPIPAISGLGLVSADVAPVGPIHDFLGVYGTLGVVPYGDPSGGCDATDPTAGCETGCASAPIGRVAPWMVLAWLVRRRR